MSQSSNLKVIQEGCSHANEVFQKRDRGRKETKIEDK
jgi:hypothetical protein